NGTVVGKVWGEPCQRTTIVLYYNKDASKEVGPGPNSPPKSWDGMTEAAENRTQDRRRGVNAPSIGCPNWTYRAYAIQNRIELLSGDGTKTFFDDPAAIEALQYWRDLGAKHKVMPEGTVEWGTLRQAFVQGQTAMMWHTTGNLTAVKKEAKFDFGVA